LKELEEENIISENNPTKGRRMKWDRTKVIRQKLVGEIQRIQTKMDVLTQLYPDTSKDIHKLTINTKERPKQDWEILPYYEESKEK